MSARSLLPFRIVVALRSMALAAALAGWLGAKAAEPAPAAAGRGTILVVGDSLTAGLGLDPAEAYPALLQQKIHEAGWNYAVVNAGVSGDTTAGGRSRIDWLLRQRVDVLVLALGANDGLRGIPVEATKSNLQAIIDRTRQKYPPVTILLAGMMLPPNMGAEYDRAFQRIFPELARANAVTLVPFLLAGVGGQAQLNQADQMHPTADGQKLVADNVWKELRPVLEKLNPSPP